MCLDELYWSTFHNQMRSEHTEYYRYITVLLMCVEFVNGDRKCRVMQNDGRGHAEQNALRFLKELDIKCR